MKELNIQTQAIEASMDGIAILDSHEGYIYVNNAHAEIYGYDTPDELLGKNWKILYDKEELEIFEKEIMPEFRKKGKWRGESIGRKKDGTLFCQEISLTALKNGGLVCVVRDITRQKENEKEKLNAQKTASEQEKLALIGQMAGKMAHDFNNILGVIMGNAEIALLDCPHDPTRKTLELIFEQTQRGRNLTRNLVAFAKGNKLRQEFFSVHGKIDLVLSLLNKDLKGINVIREYGSDLPDVLADPGMIEHSLVNVIQNAVHATSRSDNPVIIVRCFTHGNDLTIEIQDNGCGIPPGYLDKIYEPAFTLKGSRDKTGAYKKGIKGTGYGLSNVKKYIGQHRGDMSITSQEGKGTRVSITLPVIKKELSAEDIKEIKKNTFFSEKYILIVEDETSISDVMCRILTSEPCRHRVDVAASGQMAMDRLDRNQYDMISLDYILKDEINGMDVYHYIRKKNPDIPVLFVSGNLEFLENIKNLQKKDPRIDYLSKPCQNKAYINCINKLLQSKENSTKSSRQN
ncbi:MAG: ATP-binding protein [Desulfobacteraceae bacterium]